MYPSTVTANVSYASFAAVSTCPFMSRKMSHLLTSLINLTHYAREHPKWIFPQSLWPKESGGPR